MAYRAAILCLAFVTTAAALPSWANPLFRRADCTVQTVQDGDSCGSLAERCDISGEDLAKYNPDPDLCSSLTLGERVCCSSGTLPDITPKAEPNGTCASHIVEEDETCSSIAAANGLKASNITDFNKQKTWGFNNCTKGLPLGLKICLSEGDAPLPAPMNGSLCGPTKPGTIPRTDGTKFADLNPCPLNACCNIWGQCGIDTDFCVPSKGDHGNPGTAPPGVNGCVQNCGTDIVNNDDGSDQFLSVGYYESWNMDRSCMHMSMRSISDVHTAYTHLHWAFATIEADLSVSINDTYQQFPEFVGLGSATKRIISFGGWGVSTDPATYDLLRQATSEENRDAFTDNVVDLLNKYSLDGVDFDWEYPGAPDIPNIPPGKPEDGDNYLQMLKMIREKLPEGKTLSIAAPASYWYLKAFPIKNIAKVVNYIVFMTYDLHGQWDHGSPYAESGCPAGDCLRSHVNMTETLTALAMITKAGVPSNKIVVGVSSYGRSFNMTDPNCSGPMCTYVGPESGAKPGMCTDTAGILANAEINTIIRQGGTEQTWFDDDSMTDLLVYEGTQWVAYMSDETKRARKERYEGLNFAGTIDWALDLEAFSEDDGCPAGTCDKPGVLYVAPDIYTQINPVITCPPPCQIILPPLKLPTQTTVTFPPYTTSLEVAWTTTLATVVQGSTITTTTIARTVVTTTLTIPPVTTTEIEFWNTAISNSSNVTAIYLTTSILPPPFTIIDDPNPESKEGVTHPPVTRTITPPPFPYSFSTPTDPVNTTPDPGQAVIPVMISIATEGPAGPSCTANCGHSCVLYCDHPCLHCPPGGESGSDSDFFAPNDPNPPPFPPSPEDAPPDGGVEPCQPDVKTETGLCPNGNKPIFNPVTMQVQCDIADRDVSLFISSCQEAIDRDLANSVAQAELSSQCCAANKGELAGLQAGPACPNPNLGNNPSPGQPTFTCDFNLWPNVCANARSAISSRNKPDVLTYVASSNLHATDPWYNGKWQAGGQPQGQFDGWGLINCEVEEYPWGSGNPNRQPNLRLWDEQAVLRLIPREENNLHAQELKNFYRSNHMANQMPYSIEFTNGPSGTSDSDYYLGDDTSHNRCAEPYGNAFLLVNRARVNPGERSYDPWWDDKLFDKTIRYKTDANGRVTSSQVVQTVSEYCKHPSPGKRWIQNGEWVRHPLGGTLARRDQPSSWACDDFPGYTGPAAHPIRRRGSPLVSGLEPSLPAIEGRSPYRYRLEDKAWLQAYEEKYRPRNATNDANASQGGLEVEQAIQAVQVSGGSGSFLDASAFLYLGCGTNDDDPCYYMGDACSESDGDDYTIPELAPSPTTEPPPSPTPTPVEKTAYCTYLYTPFLIIFDIYNMQGWSEDGGDRLHHEENGCGALTGWEWDDVGVSGVGHEVTFNLPLLMKAGCVERAIKSAGGPDDIQCTDGGF